MSSEPQGNNPNLLQRILLKVEYTKKINFVTGILVSITLLVTYLLISGLIREISFTKHELLGNQYQQAVHNILDDISHYMITPKSNKSAIAALDEQIELSFAELILLNRKYENELKTRKEDFQLREEADISPLVIFEQWKEEAFEESSSYYKTVQRLRDLLRYVGDTSNMAYDPEVETHYLMESVLLSLPREKQLITQIITLARNSNQNGELTPQQRYELNAISSTLYSSAMITKQAINKSIVEETNLNLRTDTKNNIEPPLQNYIRSIEILTSNIAASLIKEFDADSWSSFAPFLFSKKEAPAEALSEDKLISLGTSAIKNNDLIRNVLTLEIDTVLQNRILKMRWERFFIIGAVLFGLSISLSVGYVVMKETNLFFKNVYNAILRFSEGDLSARAPVTYDRAFEQMRKILNELGQRIEGLIEQLQQSGVQLTTITTEIASAAKHQEGTVCQQEATVKQILVTAGEISSTAKEFAKTMNKVSSSADETSSLASSGKEGLVQMEETMRNMVEASKNIASKLSVLNEKTGTITSVITTITKVADQTNLLSLNASIEAEKAGEHGKSFAVIAREIRRLADQTANATLDIEQMVSDMMSAVSEGVMGVDKFSEEIRTGANQVSTVSEQLSCIITQVQQQTTSYEYVNKGMQAQSLGAEQINESIMQLSDAAQETTNSIRQFHTAIEQLNIASKEMQACVSRMKN